MVQKTASRTATVWMYRLNYLAGALGLLNFLASLTGRGNFANTRHYDWQSLAGSVVFLLIGISFKTTPGKTK